MKYISSIFMFVLLSACQNVSVNNGSSDKKSKEDKQTRIIHEFIAHLKTGDTKAALAMIDYADSTKTLLENTNTEKELRERIENAEKSIQHYDINDSTWETYKDTTTTKSHTYTLVGVNSKELDEVPLSRYCISFFFDITVSDTILKGFHFDLLGKRKKR